MEFAGFAGLPDGPAGFRFERPDGAALGRAEGPAVRAAVAALGGDETEVVTVRLAMSPEPAVVAVEPSVASLAGWPARSLLDIARVWDLVHPDDFGPLLGLTMEASGEQRRLRLRTASGGVLHCDVSATATGPDHVELRFATAAAPARTVTSDAAGPVLVEGHLVAGVVRDARTVGDRTGILDGIAANRVIGAGGLVPLEAFGEAGSDGVRQCVAEVPHPAGDDRWLHISALVDLAGRFCAHVCDVSERRRLAARVSHMALYDALTGLPNRRLLLDRLHQALARHVRTGTPLAVLYVDLDGFKSINDRFGHEVGDRVLVSVAQRLAQAVRSVDTAARLAGDEFVIVAEDVSMAVATTELPRRVLAAVSEPIVVDDGSLSGRIVDPGASVGVLVVAEGDHDVHAVLRMADAAMFRAKEAGKGRYAVEVLHADGVRRPGPALR